MDRGAPTDAAPRARTRAAERGQLGFGIAMLALLCLLVAPFFLARTAPGGPQVRDGAVDFAGSALARPVELGGEWRFTLRGPGGHIYGPIAKHVPGTWAGSRTAAGVLPNRGLATYELTLAGFVPGQYRLHITTIYGASRVLIDGRPLSVRGVLGHDAASTRYEWRAHDVAFAATGRPVVLTVQAAAFQHRDTGIENAPVLGAAEPMGDWIAFRWAQEFLTHVALMLLGLYSLTVFVHRRSERASLYLAAACFLYLPASAVLGFDNILRLLFPGIGFTAELALLYLPTELALAAFLAYVHALFPREAVRTVFFGLLGIIGALFLVQALTLAAGDTRLASLENRAFILVILGVLSYSGFVLARAARASREGALVFLLGVFAFLVTVLMISIVSYGILPSDRVTGIDFTGYGMLVLLFSHIIVLAQRWSGAIRAAEATNDDLRQLLDVNSAITSEMQLEALLAKIVEAMSRILHADRSSLFLYDPKTDELWSLVAEGVETRAIRFPAGRGLAGHVLRTGETINAARAYEDPRFNPAVDEQTGYRTESVLTLPVTARDGRRLGVMQALNRQGHDRFTREDQARMAAFAAQAAIAIDNASLFSAVAAARTYNDAILRSMSSGVITLDADRRLITVNDAARAILEFGDARVEGRDAARFIGRTNPWLLALLDGVVADGQRRRILDADLTTARGQIVSANVTVVPLRGEDQALGLLIFVEDISQNKRLEGAMRRFMPQNLVAQVLERRELLSGAACTASVLFADVRNFTALAESLPPRDTVEILNEIFAELFEAVVAHDGVLDKFIGDAVMAVYGAPIPTGRDPENAVASALAMQRAIAVINDRRAARGEPPIRLGIGIATGEVIAGTVGSPKRMDYTVIGDRVNLAARLEELTKTHGVGIIVCAATAHAVEGKVTLRPLGETQLRGRQASETIYEVSE